MAALRIWVWIPSRMFKELFPRIRSFICARGQLYRMSSNRKFIAVEAMMKSFPEACWNRGCGVRDVWLRKVWDFELRGFLEVKKLDDQVLELIVELLSTPARFIFQGFAYSARELSTIQWRESQGRASPTCDHLRSSRRSWHRANCAYGLLPQRPPRQWTCQYQLNRPARIFGADCQPGW